MKYLHCVLTVIAFCLIVITGSLLHLFPEAKANSGNLPASFRVNSDGSINVRLITDQNDPMKVNLTQIAGFRFDSRASNNGLSVQPAVHVIVEK